MGLTIRDVAKHAGVSVATVSRYLNNSPLIAPDSVEKVRRSIQELHYEPNFIARSMVTQHSHMVALLVDNSNPETFGNESFLRIQYGMEHALAEHGYYLMILSIDSTIREKALFKTIHEKRMDGIILPAQFAHKTLCRALEERGIPFVVIGKTKLGSWIDIDNAMAGRIATEKLLAAGARDIRFLGNGYEKIFVKERFKGFQSAMEAAGAAVPPGIECAASAERGMAYIQSIAELPEAFVVSDNETAFGILSTLRDRGVSVPERTQVVSFDDGVVARLCNPPLTVVDIDVHQLGIQAANMLYLQLQSSEAIVQQCLMPVRIIERGTTR